MVHRVVARRRIAATSSATTSVVATLFPGYFALPMATGVVAIAAQQQGLDLLADAWYAVAVVAYVVLVVLFILRALWYPHVVAADMTQHARGFAFLTIVAGTNVLAAASASIHGWWAVAWVLWWVSLPLWVAFLYVPLIAVVLRDDKPDPRTGINGTWLLLTVATESVAVVGALHLTRNDSDLLAFAALGAFVLGVLLYVVVVTMVFTRWTLSRLDPTEADPPSWIATGAAAITALAGSSLLAAADRHDRLERVAPFIEGVTVLAWSTATFWFPLMIAIGMWRHVVRRIPLTYHPSYWALVFPLAMYGVATFRMVTVLDVPGLDWVPRLTLAVAGVAWLLTMVGLGLRLRAGSAEVLRSRR